MMPRYIEPPPSPVEDDPFVFDPRFILYGACVAVLLYVAAVAIYTIVIGGLASLRMLGWI